jgi:hypothetical protein
MTLEMVLNELSLETPAPDIPTARQWMSELIQTIREATTTGVKRILRTKDDINSIELAPNYPIARWRNDREVNREERRFFRLLTTKAPFWTDVAEEIKNDFDLSDIFHQRKSASGLAFAFVSDSLPVSFLSKEIWDCSFLTLDIIQLHGNNNLIEEQQEIVHASKRIHVQKHRHWIKNRIRISVGNGAKLWQRRNELFPHLEFCDSVEKQISSLAVNSPILTQIKKRLFELEEAAKNWTEGNFELESLASKATPESESRLQEFKSELTIQCPDGEDRLFTYHLRMTPGAWRLYFIPFKSGHVIIGYIGRKLGI